MQSVHIPTGVCRVFKRGTQQYKSPGQSVYKLSAALWEETTNSTYPIARTTVVVLVCIISINYTIVCRHREMIQHLQNQ